MKKIILLFICSLTLSCSIINARITQRQELEDSVFGWLKVYHLKGAKEIKKIDNRVFYREEQTERQPWRLNSLPAMPPGLSGMWQPDFQTTKK